MTRTLPLLAERRAELELCVYCPKLCRAACPVSNVEPREVLIPWGKMSTAYFAARGDVAVDRPHAETAWGCTGCHACRERCEHRNDVAATLFDARASYAAEGAAPPGAVRAREGYARHVARTSRAVSRLPSSDEVGAAPVLIGCAYARALPATAREAFDACTALLEGPARALDACCGLPLLHAGDRAGFEASAGALLDRAATAGRLVVVDPGCALALRQVANARGSKVEVVPFVTLAARSLAKLAPLPADEPVRYHDACQLGRGLGFYDEPRAVLTRLFGRPPAEFADRREHATCSGAGGLLPATMPAAARAIRASRAAEHEALGGGRVVSACAKSVIAFRQAGLRADDLASLVARGLCAHRSPAP